MTPENKKVVKIIALWVGGAMILTVLTVLIVQHVKRAREAKNEDKNLDSDTGDSSPFRGNQSPSPPSTNTMNSINGRTFKKVEIEKMQSFLFNKGAIALNELIVSAIRDHGGIDGKIGSGFKTALNEAIRIKIVKNSDDLYTQAMQF